MDLKVLKTPEESNFSLSLTSFLDPDCIKCIKRKINAPAIVIFFQSKQGWRLGNFQGTKPRHMTAVEFSYMLNCGVPDIIAEHEEGLLLNDDQAIYQAFPILNQLLFGNAVIATPFSHPKQKGACLAWRNNHEPFSQEELDIIKCSGHCPGDCG